MKRSKKAALVLMVPAAALLMSGCGEKREEAMVFEDPKQCAAAGVNSAEQCESDFVAAQAMHPQVAPKYANKEECEVDFGAGNCETAPQQSSTGGSFFMPMMMGYLMGQMMNSRNAAAAAPQAATPAAAGASKVPTQPLYKSRDDRTNFRTATNKPVAGGIGPISLRPSQVKPQVGQVVRRGGFGAQAAARAANTAGG
jgi:uncharacterized protein YgiB involved in biofilm formation